MHGSSAQAGGVISAATKSISWDQPLHTVHNSGRQAARSLWRGWWTDRKGGSAQLAHREANSRLKEHGKAHQTCPQLVSIGTEHHRALGDRKQTEYFPKAGRREPKITLAGSVIWITCSLPSWQLGASVCFLNASKGQKSLTWVIYREWQSTDKKWHNERPRIHAT